MWGYCKKAAICKWGREYSPDPDCAGTMTADFPTSRMGSKCLVFQSCELSYFAIASWAETPGILTLFTRIVFLRIDCCCCSLAKSCPTLCDPMDWSAPGFPVLHYLLEFAQIPVHWVSDAIQPSHPLLPSPPPALNLSQHQGNGCISLA